MVYPHAGIEVDAVEHYRELLSSGRVTRIYLDQLPGQGFGAATLRFVVSAEGEAMGQVRSLVEQSQTKFTNPILQAELLDFLETLVVYKFPQLSREEIGKMFGTQDLKQTRFYQDVVQEGIQRGEAELTLRLLRRKVGDIPLSLQTQIRALPVEQMEELGEALLDFGAMSDLTDWLGSLP
ncbi:MAG: DUF4351 domain-containing protein [Synechococcaceae cyanobacterium RM1_1_27]|nr:DUF4351 domain-containing protein [Synechococcaceae cyanobacterium RM1_1_27]